MDKAGILVEFRKHLDLVQPFSIDVGRSLQRIDSSKYNDAPRNLNEYLDNCGSFKSNINSIQSWFEMRSVTGIVHDTILSYTRLVADPGVVRWRNIGSDKWDPYDVNLIVGVLGTICGMEEGRHVMGNDVDGEAFDKNIQDELDEYEGKASTLKESYKEGLLAGDKEEFNNFGFILTDYSPDNFDGKQLTITSERENTLRMQRRLESCRVNVDNISRILYFIHNFEIHKVAVEVFFSRPACGTIVQFVLGYHNDTYMYYAPASLMKNRADDVRSFVRLTMGGSAL